MSKYFDKSKHYVFRKEIYLTEPAQVMSYKNSPSCREWVGEMDGQEVQIIDELGGLVQVGAVFYFIPTGWCEEIIPHMTQVVREVANQRYKTALERALQQHPEMIEDKIIRYGCPDRYGVGEQPSWCQRPELMVVDSCRKCWDQKGEMK